MFRKVIALTILTGFFATLGVAASVGAAPGSLDMGEVEPGDTIEETIYITTNYDNTFLIEPSVRTGPRSSNFESNRASEISEKNIADWFEVQDSAEIDPNSTQTFELADGSTVNAEGFFEFTLDVPTDAEPGYHHAYFRLNPELHSDQGGASTVNWGETRPNLRFRVSGHAERNIEITDVRGIRVGDEEVQIVKQLQNTGTVTTGLTGGNLSILNQDDEEIDELDIGSALLAPGEVAEIDTTWSSENVQGGNYRVEGIGDYRTGETHISGDFAITDVVRDPVDIDEPEAETEGDADIPYTLLLMVLLFLGVILYLLEVDLVWTIIFVGVTGISLFILFSSAPSYLILILAAVIGVTLYYGI